jgi:hypothetical protein
METVYIEGDALAFATFVRSHGIGDKANLIAHEGFYRWQIERKDGSFYIARPSESKPQ